MFDRVLYILLVNFKPHNFKLFSLAAPQVSIIRRSLDVLESQTCVRFQKFELGKTLRDYINVMS